MPPKYLWRSRRYCLRYYFDIWEHNAADSRNIAGLYRRHACQVELAIVSTSQVCRRSRLTWPLLPATSVLISERYHSSTGSRIGVMSQVAPRHMRTRLNAPYPPFPGVGFPASASDSFGICARWDASCGGAFVNQVRELVLGRPTGAWQNKHSIRIRRKLNLDRLLFPLPGTTMLSWFSGV